MVMRGISYGANWAFKMSAPKSHVPHKFALQLACKTHEPAELQEQELYSYGTAVDEISP